MDFLIDLWVSIPDTLRNKIIVLVSFGIPAIFVLLIKQRWLGFVLGTLFFMLPGLLDYYLSCSREIIFCNPGDSREVGPYLFGFLIGFIYCLLIRFTLWMIKNIKDYK